MAGTCTCRARFGPDNEINLSAAVPAASTELFAKLEGVDHALWNVCEKGKYIPTFLCRRDCRSVPLHCSRPIGKHRWAVHLLSKWSSVRRRGAIYAGSRGTSSTGRQRSGSTKD